MTGVGWGGGERDRGIGLDSAERQGNEWNWIQERKIKELICFDHYAFTGQNNTWTAPISPGVSAAAIALGGEHTCVILSGGISDGEVKCWGWNREGQLGIGSTTDQTSPVDVPGRRGDVWRAMCVCVCARVVASVGVLASAAPPHSYPASCYLSS